MVLSSYKHDVMKGILCKPSQKEKLTFNTFSTLVLQDEIVASSNCFSVGSSISKTGKINQENEESEIPPKKQC